MKSSDMLRVSRHTHGVDGQDGDRINPIFLRDDAYGVRGEIKWGLIAMIEHDVRMHVGAVVACERVRVSLQAYVGLCSYAFMHAFVQLSNSYMAAMEYKVA